MKKKFILIKGTIFPFDILFTTATDKEVFKYIAKKKYKLSQKEKETLVITGVAKTIKLLGNQIVIRLKPEKTKLGIDVPTLVHEITHATNFVMDIVGIDYDINKSEEVFSYHNQYLTREILKVLDK